MSIVYVMHAWAAAAAKSNTHSWFFSRTTKESSRERCESHPLLLLRLLLLDVLDAVAPADSLGVIDDGESALDGVEDDVLDLKLVLRELLRGGHVLHGLHEVEHAGQRLGRREVDVHGDARLQVLHLREGERVSPIQCLVSFIRGQVWMNDAELQNLQFKNCEENINARQGWGCFFTNESSSLTLE